MPRNLSDQIRGAVEKSELSRYAIGRLAKIDQATLSRFMAGSGGLSLDSLNRLGHVLGLSVVVKTPNRKGKKMSTQPGYLNQQQQRVIGRVGQSPSHPNQYTYEMECTICGTRYGANGCDIDGANQGAGRRCPNPNCQQGTPGDPI
jgi:hypothetical protein